MASLKHVGRVVNTGRKCVVVFREIYDDKGHVTDENHCLVFETENLPDAEHQDLMRIIESEQAQTTGDLYNVLGRSRLGTGVTALTWLANSNRLRKYPTSNIELTPDSRAVLGLHTLNKIVKMQKAGATEKDINNVLRDDTDMSPRSADSISETMQETPVVAETQSADGVLDDTVIAKQRLDQAEIFESQAKELRDQAYTMDPSLKPKSTRKRAAPMKSTAK
jgi:hypothetical protein